MPLARPTRLVELSAPQRAVLDAVCAAYGYSDTATLAYVSPSGTIMVVNLRPGTVAGTRRQCALVRGGEYHNEPHVVDDSTWNLVEFGN